MSEAAAWTDARIEELKRLWGEGFSASQIARALGGAITRNSVLAKIHRLKNAGDPLLERRTTSPTPRERIIRTNTPRPAVPKPRPAPDEPLPLAREDGAPVTLDNCRHDECRWPHGDGENFRICDHKIEEGFAHPYCAFHLMRSSAGKASEPYRGKWRGDFHPAKRAFG